MLKSAIRHYLPLGLSEDIHLLRYNALTVPPYLQVRN